MAFEGSIVFVHGTAVRDEGYRTYFSNVRQGLLTTGIVTRSEQVVGLPWYLHHGAETDDLVQTLPPTYRRMGTATNSGTPEANLRELLALDPLTELRFLAAQSAGGVAIGDPVARASELLGEATDLSAPGSGVTQDELRRALVGVLASEPFKQSVRKTGDNEGPFLDVVNAVARATVASALLARQAAGGVAPLAAVSLPTREVLEHHVEARLFATVRPQSVVEWITGRVKAWASDRAFDWVSQRRADLVGPAGRFSGDLLRYVRHSNDLLRYLKAGVETAPAPRVLIGHSLGGIMLVDLMSGPDALADVPLLVTAGSQSPVLYLVKALAHLEKGDGKAPFRPWVNYYDPDDLLSFCASDVLPGAEDVEMPSHVPFPDCHSAYWTNGALFDHLRVRMVQLGLL